MESDHFYRGNGSRHRAPTMEASPPPRTDPESARRGKRSLGNLIGDLGAQMQTLVRLEIQLAKAELTEQISTAGKGAGMMAAAGAVAYGGFLALIAALGFVLASFMPEWIGFLCAGIAVLAIAAIMFASGRKALAKANFNLNQTSRTLDEDALWMRQEAAEVKRDPAHLGSGRAGR